ncbi:MAG: fatty acid desaturase [Planctomycetes bacterium]|nr:fatty acid desaturase [Planctomycetota bacterium]
MPEQLIGSGTADYLPGEGAVPHSVVTPAPSHPKRLGRPAGTTHQIVWRYVIPITTIHLLAFVVFIPRLFSWSGLALLVVGISVFGSGINIGYHRLLTHRSFKCPEWVERCFVILAVCCMQDAPATWVATHRLHHKDSDDTPDPHSPLVGFWWSHIGWSFLENRDINNAATYERYARDILRKPFYLWLQRGIATLWVYLAQVLVFFAVGFLVGWLTNGAAAGVRLGLSWVAWGVILRTVVVWHLTWSVNSLSHMFGYRTHETGEQSRNNWLVALGTNGEGWHNNHHVSPNSATNWHRWWEVDLTYVVIRILELLGLASDVIRPTRLLSKHKDKNAA